MTNETLTKKGSLAYYILRRAIILFPFNDTNLNQKISNYLTSLRSFQQLMNYI